MSNYVPPPDKNDGEILYGIDWNTLKNGLQSFLNFLNLGNSNISEDPAQKIKAAKVDFDTASHGSTHEPGGVDEVNDIDIDDTGTLLSVHASRHADGGPDPLPAASVSGAMLKPSTFGRANLVSRKDSQSLIATNLGLTFTNDPGQIFVLSAGTLNPTGNGVVRSGKVYFSIPGAVPDAVLELDPATGTEVFVTLASGDDPADLVLVGTDIYVLCQGTFKIKKIDSGNVVTEILDINADPTMPATIDRIRGLCPNGDGTVMYSVAKIPGEANEHQILRMQVDPSGDVTHVRDFGTLTELSLPWFVKRGSTEYVVAIAGRASGTNDVVYRSDAADLTAVDSLTLSTNTDDRPNKAVYDGMFLVGVDIGGPIIYLVNVWAATMFEAARFTGPGDIPRDVGVAQFFDGRAICLGTKGGGNLTALTRIPYPNYQAGSEFLVSAIGTGSINGFATDGNYLYAAVSNGATSDAQIIQLPM